MTQQHSLHATATQRYPLLAVAADSHLARLMLAFLATAGLFYVNIMPALVSGLIEGRGFSARDAGVIGSCNVYGAAVGAFIAIFLVKKLPWKTASAVLLLLLISLDLISMLLTTPLPMMLNARILRSGCGLVISPYRPRPIKTAAHRPNTLATVIMTRRPAAARTFTPRRFSRPG